MSKKYVLIGLLLLLLSSPLGLSHAAIFTENFNSATGTGLLQNDLLKSEKWDPTNYYVGTAASLTGWTFSSSGAYVATNSDALDKAILLNESPGHGTMQSPAISVNPGGLYLLTFEH